MKMYRWLITIQAEREYCSIFTRSVIHENRKRYVNFSMWLTDYVKKEGLSSAAIINIENLPPKCVRK